MTLPERSDLHFAWFGKENPHAGRSHSEGDHSKGTGLSQKPAGAGPLRGSVRVRSGPEAAAAAACESAHGGGERTRRSHEGLFRSHAQKRSRQPHPRPAERPDLYRRNHDAGRAFVPSVGDTGRQEDPRQGICHHPHRPVRRRAPRVRNISDRPERGGAAARRVPLSADAPCARVPAPDRRHPGNHKSDAVRPEMGGQSQRGILLVGRSLPRGVALRHLRPPHRAHRRRPCGTGALYGLHRSGARNVRYRRFPA